MSSQPGQSKWSEKFQASYTVKDVIQYALAIGFGTENKDPELRFVYEGDGCLEAFPSFCFVLPNWATSTPNSSFSFIQPFPTPLMKRTGVIPSTCLQKGIVDIETYPVIQIAQSAVWFQDLPIPSPFSSDDPDSLVQTLVSTRVVAVRPKSIGTFVEIETRIQLKNGNKLCALGATFLVLGIDANNVLPMVRIHSDTIFRHTCQIPNSPPDFEWSYTTTPNQALLYRMASGDFNKIHVDLSSNPSRLMKSIIGSHGRPILHGQCTLGIALRGLLLKFLNNQNVSLVSLRAQFTKPVFVGDTLRIEAWKPEPGRLLFRVIQDSSNAIVVDCGELTTNEKASSVPTLSSRL